MDIPHIGYLLTLSALPRVDTDDIDIVHSVHAIDNLFSVHVALASASKSIYIPVALTSFELAPL